MALTLPTKEQIFSSILTLYRAIRPDADYTKGSDLWLNSKIWAVQIQRLHRTFNQALDAIFFDSSFGTYLGALLNLYGLPDGQGGYGYILPHISSASSGLTCTTTTGVLANAWQNQQLTDTAGRTYVCTEAHGAIGAATSTNLDIESVDTGFEVNLESGTTLTWVAAPAGSATTAVTCADLRGGTPLEDESGGQVRLLKRVRNPSASGNVADWVETIENVLPGNLKAWVWPQRQNQPYGWNSTDYCATYSQESGTARHIAAADEVYTDIDDAVSAAMPALSYRNSRQLTLTSVPTDVTLTTTLGSSPTSDQKCDWDAEGNKTTVNGTVYGSKQITALANICIGAVTNGLSVGDKVVINGYEAIAATVDVGGDAKVFTVEDWPAEWPTGAAAMDGLNITSGGGFIGHLEQTSSAGVVSDGTGIVEAIREYMDGRGPNDSYNGATSEIPGWASDVKLQQLESTCFVVGGGIIEVVSVALPATDLSHTAEDGATAKIYDVGEITAWQVFV
jgi:uncharacterized phage protein gp47/JayE